jgi:hypothetical protein
MLSDNYVCYQMGLFHHFISMVTLSTVMMPVGTATIRATQWIINASYNQRQRFFHLSPEPLML